MMRVGEHSTYQFIRMVSACLTKCRVICTVAFGEGTSFKLIKPFSVTCQYLQCHVLTSHIKKALYMSTMLRLHEVGETSVPGTSQTRASNQNNAVPSLIGASRWSAIRSIEIDLLARAAHNVHTLKSLLGHALRIYVILQDSESQAD